MGEPPPVSFAFTHKFCWFGSWGLKLSLRGELLRAPKHRFPGKKKISLRALGHPKNHTKASEGTAKETEGLWGYPNPPEGHGWSSAGFPFHQGNTKANQELREAEGFGALQRGWRGLRGPGGTKIHVEGRGGSP